MLVTLIIVSCDGVIKEKKRIVGICHNQQGILPLYSRERDEIFKFLEFIESSKPLYTAAGYFAINRSTTFELLSVVTTYFIVLTQFKEYL